MILHAMDFMNTSCSCLGIALILALLVELLHIPFTQADYPGVIEIEGYSNRRARTHYMPQQLHRQMANDDATLAPPPAKFQADIETVKQNIEKYNKLLTLDTKNLPESQKDMLERIVERVARLKETLDIEEYNTGRKNSSLKQANSTTTKIKESEGQKTTTEQSMSPLETETDSTLPLDETTLMHLQNSMNEIIGTQATAQDTAQTIRLRDAPTTTTEFNFQTGGGGGGDAATSSIEDSNSDASSTSQGTMPTTTIDPQTDVTDPADEQFVAARANNNIGAITAADETSSTLSTNQQRTLTTSSKLNKTRATKRPGSGQVGSTKTGSTHSKRVQRPSSNAHHASTSAGLSKKSTTKHKLAGAGGSSAGATTIQPQQYTNPKQPYKQQQKVSIADKIASVTSDTFGTELRTSPSTSSVAGNGYGGSTTSTNGYNDLVYDEHVNTSALIDSLSNVREEFYQQQKHTINTKDKKPLSATAKPTKYHYYPHNQHIYLLPECAIQQVCNAVYVRLNYTQPLCACPSRYRDPCSASLNEDDQHTTKLVGDGKKKAITLAKTCEATTEMRDCRSPKDWSLLALQNTRTGKSHYLVICRCPDHYKMEGPMAHDQPSYAAVPGIRVFGMMCVKAGYSVRKPQVQPPKRFYLQKPFHRPNTQTSFINNNQYGGGGGSSNARPSYNTGGGLSSSSAFSSNGNSYHSSQDSSNLQHQQSQSSYQYLKRPEGIHGSNSNSYRPETLTSINNFPGSGSIYGRNNERQGETPIEAQTPTFADSTESSDDGNSMINTSTQPAEVAPSTISADVDIELSDNGSKSDEILTPPPAAAAAMETAATANSEGSESRSKRSIVEEDLNDGFEDSEDIPEFPWDRVIEFQKTLHWD